MNRTLDQGWTVRAVGGEVPPVAANLRIPATVPGCIHTDLLAAGLIPDPYLDTNEDDVAWIGSVDWRYETSVEWAADDATNVDLVALGLDTVATVELNGEVVAQTENMHRSYRFPVSGLLREGSNELAVTFAAPVPAASGASEGLGPRPYISSFPFNAIRKMACNFGWDWGPELVTAGIWRPLSLQTWAVARIASVRPLVDVEGSTGLLHTHVEVQRAPGNERPITVTVQIAGASTEVAVPAGSDRVTLETVIEDADLWWPRGYGDQPLYPVAVWLSSDGIRLDEWNGRVGFRTVTLDTTPDVDGTPFSIAVNGQPVFARGVNWIPDDCFPSRLTPERYAARLTQAYDAGVNLVRVWGGGLYESEDFYNVCDELGLLVWQDFLFACAAYAEEEPLRSEVIAEAREAITRLSAHPSLALWNGNNENIWGFDEWGWRSELDGWTWGWGYYTEVLPGLLAELDPTRPYSPGCPYSMSPELPPNDPAHGTMHLWEAWNRLDYTSYHEVRPRFVSEFGWQGPPTWATLVRAIHDRPLASDSPGVLHHQKAEDGNGKLARGLERHLPEPATFEDWHWATSLNQARAIRYGLDHLRSLSPLCRGAVVWQLNDCWPVTSWAAVDGDGRRKPLWYALRQSFADQLLTIQPRDGSLALVAVNDSGDAWSASATVTRRSFDGTVLASSEFALDLAPRAVTAIRLPAELAEADDVNRELLLAEAGGRRAWWPFAEDRDAELPEAELRTWVSTVPGGYRVEVTAGTLVRDLAVLADRLAPDAEVDEMLVTLLPGESASFTVNTTATLTPEELTGPLVLRSANQLVALVAAAGTGSR